MATIVVFDDEPAYLARIHQLIEQEAPQDGTRTILEAASLGELKDILASGVHIDILVVDITMPEGQPSGIDVVRELFPPSSGTQIIYTSGDLGQAPEVYATQHLYFLLKPIDAGKLHEALERAYAALPQSRPAMLRIKCGHKHRLVNANLIRYLESNLRKVCVHCGNTTYTTYARLDDLQEQLPAHFSRCHRSYLVNLAYVSALEETEARLHDGTVIPVSRRRSRTAQRDLLTYLATQEG
ncbi:MAG: LytTR family DNA-binding domain-containing protein [Coriobacteriales bacterium]|nr:LytTR family DNA-binding domain-containing protein [Coriobacteriales bacterium]